MPRIVVTNSKNECSQYPTSVQRSVHCNIILRSARRSPLVSEMHELCVRDQSMCCRHFRCSSFVISKMNAQEQTNENCTIPPAIISRTIIVRNIVCTGRNSILFLHTSCRYKRLQLSCFQPCSRFDRTTRETTIPVRQHVRIAYTTLTYAAVIPLISVLAYAEGIIARACANTPLAAVVGTLSERRRH